MIDRTIATRIQRKIGRGKAIVVVGPRQVGKTTLIRSLLAQAPPLFLDGDDPTVRQLLASPNTETLRRIVGNKRVVFIDEAQRIEGIGLTLKIVVDQLPEVQLWVSGSSSFDLFSELSEPLTGRKWEYELLPISWEEYEQHVGYALAEQQLETRLLYGFYPDVLNHPGEEVEILQNLVNSYLYRDVLAYADVRKPQVLDQLVRALALQVGSELNYNEISQLIGVDRNTVVKYLDILEKGYVVFQLGSFSRNVRNEIKKGRKVYFYDNGVRNTVVGNFEDIRLRADKGALWENFLVAERLKQNQYKMTLARPYFWRTTQQQEIDYVEEERQRLAGYEFKWHLSKAPKLPKTFTQQYGATAQIVTRDNFRDFVVIP